MVADLPPSSRNSRFTLFHDPLADGGGAGERDQVDLRGQRELLAHQVIRSGHNVDDTRWDVGVFGDQPAEPGRIERRVGRGLEHHGVAGAQRLTDFVDGDLEREVPRHDRADHPDRFPPNLAGGEGAGEADRLVAQVGFPRVLVDEPGRIAQPVLQRRIQLGTESDCPGGTDFEDELLAQLLALGVDRLVQLQQAALPQRTVGRPIGLVEGPPGGVDGPAHVFG
jgi:hypothetical protein